MICEDIIESFNLCVSSRFSVLRVRIINSKVKVLSYKKSELSKTKIMRLCECIRIPCISGFVCCREMDIIAEIRCGVNGFYSRRSPG